MVQALTAWMDEKEKLLENRTTELNAAQAFLTRVDAVSEAEVVATIDSLNTLISSTLRSLGTNENLYLGHLSTSLTPVKSVTTS